MSEVERTPAEWAMVYMNDAVRELEAQLEAAFKAAVEEHARRTGGVHVGDTITFDEYEVDAAIHEHMPPASLMPSCRTWPALSSR